MNASVDVFSLLQELHDLPNGVRPLQFASLMAGAQYLPIYRLGRRYSRPGLSALDWGCGNCHFSYFLLREGLKVEGFNLGSGGSPLANYLKDNYGEDYGMVEGDPADPVRLPFADQRFDLVFSIGVLEHVRETGGSENASLGEIVRVLRPGGYFVCGMLPKRYSWIEFLVRHAFQSKHQHAYRYTQTDIETLVEGAGLDLVETAPHGFLPRNSWNHRWLRPIGNGSLLTHGFNALDCALARAFSPIAQNFMFSARKPG
ncbi:MAG: class I SAM-dependent methyltransferase [Thermoanaerobaculia bacterium]|nr:class I SAM-dependent methyltransferase [Thermoanaerobaculia bacterium]